MNRASVLRKVKACLRLAASPNAHEAAAALRQAQAMMAAHGISHAEAMDVGEFEVKTRFRGASPPQSISFLVNVVAAGFGATVLFMLRAGATVIRFYGADSAAEIAAYAFVVLRRQLDADRLKHVTRIRKRGNRVARGEVFAIHWVDSVRHLFPPAEVSAEKRLAVDSVMQAQFPDSYKTPGRDLTTKGKTGYRDAVAGNRAGRAARLRRAVGGSATPALEHQP